LAYLSVAGLHDAVSKFTKTREYCGACFTGSYPVPIPKGAELDW
jgi:glutamine phosphoribosylpyrophosphate amidotransferase